MAGKQYGLILPKKESLKPRLSVFGEESDEGEDGTDWVQKALKREAERSVQKKQTQLDIKRALEQDETVFQYDEVFGEMTKKKEEAQKVKKAESQKSRYIPALMQHAERRKREHERRTERQLQKDREAEGDEFKDKESFVTSSYRKKVEEFAKMDAEDHHQEKIEELMDVTKQKDMSAFYNSLYKQTVEPENTLISEGKMKVKIDKADKKSKEKSSDKKSRQYRKRKNSTTSGSSSSEDEHSPKKCRTKNKSNVTGDTDDSLSSSSSSEQNDEVLETKEVIKEEEKENFVSGSEEGEICSAGGDDKEVQSPTNTKEKTSSHDTNEDKSSKPANTEKNPPATPKVNIWEKRTVGNVFEEALRRYFERKAAKSMKI
uniref:(California timema) hypothetical protein n=1 Tax=Timema californicum TaxID=61474 RepID=A0A7R9PCP6_TIMCA|nr:unnamed protein product [Timema californicum]